MQWLQDGPFFPFVDHLTPAKVARILPEDSEPGKRIITLNQLVQLGNCRVIKPLRQNIPQPQPFIRKNPAYQLPERGGNRRSMILCSLSYMISSVATKPVSHITANNLKCGLIFGAVKTVLMIMACNRTGAQIFPAEHSARA